MDFKHSSLSLFCASLLFTCAAFTISPSNSDRKKDKKIKKKAHTLIISPTQLNSSSVHSLSLTSSLNCFQTPLDYLPTFYSVAKDTTHKEVISTILENQQDEQDDIFALLDDEANQKTDENNLELNTEEINFSTANNLSISPQLLEKIAVRKDFVTSLVDIAVAQEGVPYVHGGKSPRGFDCSGFVSYVYSQFKINLPASSSSYDHVGKTVKLKDAQVGDILCFTGRNSRSGRTGHVGIIIENNPNEPIKFIHAASGRRRQITYSTMESSYYKPRFRSVRRISAPLVEEIESAE